LPKSVRLFPVLAVLFFVGCSSSPNSEDVQDLLEKKFKAELDKHHETRNAFGSLVSGAFGQVPSSGNPTSDSVELSNLEIVDEKLRENLFGKEIHIYTVTLDASYEVHGSKKKETGQKGHVSIVDTDNGWKVAQFSFDNFLGFRRFN
jgi:hypothetical protein